MNGWLCQDCKSVNSSSANNCYRCWTPRRFAEAPDAATLPPGVTVEQAHAERKQQLRPSIADARSSRRRSWVVLACISVTVAFSALSLAFVGAKGGSLGIALGLLSGDWTTLGSLLAISLVGGVLSLLAAIAWFVWFDRVLANVPPLTGTWPEIGRPMAVVWWLVPIIGQFKGTFVVGHIYELMAVAGSPGLWLLGMWGVTWIGGTMAPGVAGFVVGWLPLSLEESIGLQDLISNLGQISYIAAGFFAAALILAFEHARDVRMAGQVDTREVRSEPTFVDRLGDRTAPSPTPEPMPATAWSSGPTAWADGPGGPTDPDLPGWAIPEPPGTTRPGPLSGVGPVTSADPFLSPAAKGSRKDRGPVPFEPILLMGALVLAGVVGGITMAGIADPFGDLGRVAGQGLVGATPPPTPSTGALVSPDPSRPAAPASIVAPTNAVAQATIIPDGPAPASVAPSLAPARTPAPPDLVARRLVRTVTSERYRGLADVDGTYTDGTGDATWSVRLGRAAGREWRLDEVQRLGVDPEVLERVILVSTVWERGARTDWVQRRRVDRDRPTPPLFDLTDAGQLSFEGTIEEDGTRLYRFGWDARDAQIQRFARSLGAAEGMTLISGELLTTERGTPVRLELSLVGDAPEGAADPSLRMTVRYSKVGSEIEVRNPRIGPPLVVRS